MKKIYLNILTGLACLLGSQVIAQTTPNYGFSQFSGVYTAITGGTVFGNTFSDDQMFVDASNPLGTFNPATGPGLPLGFNFTFNSNVYDVIGINNNGWITLGQSTLGGSAIDSDIGFQSTFNNPLAFSTSAAPLALQAKIAGLATDLRQQTGSVLSMEVLGTSPNQIAVVQFSGFRQFSAGSGNLEFQIRLYETSNFVEVVYGTMSTPATFGLAQVGLRGSAAMSDFNLRDINNPNNWASSGSGVNVFASGDFVNMQPAIGETYRWSPPPPCSTPPAANNIVASNTLVCPYVGVSLLSLSNSYTNSGISFQWESSTVSSVGPYSPLPGATTKNTSTPFSSNTTWYRAVATCSNVGSTTFAPIQIDISTTIFNTPPYFESFENNNSGFNELPNCSWLRTDTIHCRTDNTSKPSNRSPRTGSGYGNFDFSGTPGTFEYYSNGLILYAGAVYSASVWYVTPGSFNNFNNVSISFGPNQNSTGLTTLANMSTPQNNNYTSLSNTFVVASSGIYYLAIRADANFSFDFLTFDDLSIIAPCTITQNAANLSLTGQPSICFGDSATIIASGVDTYTWNFAPSNIPTIVVSPTVNTTYSVIGTNTISGCTSTQIAQVIVNPLPNVSIIPSQFQVCAGTSVNLIAIGANSYNWTTGSTSPVITVTPNTTSTYSVLASNIYGCNITLGQQIIVKPLPVISVSGNTLICTGDKINLTATGAEVYIWAAENLYIQSGTIAPEVQTTTIYTVTGTNAVACSATTTVSVVANKCTGISNITASNSQLLLYPNPTLGAFTLEMYAEGAKNISVIDVSGRTVMTQVSSETSAIMNISTLDNGVYYVQVNSNNRFETIKLIKQ